MEDSEEDSACVIVNLGKAPTKRPTKSSFMPVFKKLKFNQPDACVVTQPPVNLPLATNSAIITTPVIDAAKIATPGTVAVTSTGIENPVICSARTATSVTKFASTAPATNMTKIPADVSKSAKSTPEANSTKTASPVTKFARIATSVISTSKVTTVTNSAKTKTFVTNLAKATTSVTSLAKTATPLTSVSSLAMEAAPAPDATSEKLSGRNPVPSLARIKRITLPTASSHKRTCEGTSNAHVIQSSPDKYTGIKTRSKTKVLASSDEVLECPVSLEYSNGEPDSSKPCQSAVLKSTSDKVGTQLDYHTREKKLSVDGNMRSVNDAYDLSMVNQWYSSNTTDVPVRYLTESQCQTIRDTLDSREIEDLSVALLTCTDLAKVYLVDMIESCAKVFDDACDTWEKQLEPHLLDFPGSLASFLAKSKMSSEEYKDLVEYIREMPVLLMNMCLGAMTRNAVSLTKEGVKDILQRLTIIGQLLFCASPDVDVKSEQTPKEKRKQYSEKCADDATEDVAEIHDDKDDALQFVSMDTEFSDDEQVEAKDKISSNSPETVTLSGDFQNSKEETSMWTKIKPAVNDHEDDDVQEEAISVSMSRLPDAETDLDHKLLEEFTAHFGMDYRDIIPFETDQVADTSESEKLKSVHSDDAHVETGNREEALMMKSDKAGVECPFCMWECGNTSHVDIDDLYKKFSEHVKSAHCDEDGKPYEETLQIFKRTLLWVDNPLEPELGQVFMCPYCLNVETFRSDHYIHVMRHKNQSTHLTCFPCQKAFVSYADLLEHYSTTHHLMDILSAEQAAPKTVKWPTTFPTIVESNSKPSRAEFSFAYLDRCLEMDEKNPGLLSFLREGYPVLMAVSHAAETTPLGEKRQLHKSYSKPYKCMFECDEYFSRGDERIQHEVKHHTEAFISTYVEKYAKGSNHWGKYKLQPLVRKCSLCTAVCLGYLGLDTHMKDNHSKEVKKVQEQVKCHKCNKVFRSKQTMRSHICFRRCEHCDKVFSTKKELKRHRSLQRCLVLRPKVFCERCDVSFRTKEDLEFHCKRVHPVEKTVTSVSANLSADIKTCSRCEKKFYGKFKDSNYKWHMDQINCLSSPNFVPKPREKKKAMYKCPRCFKRFFGEKNYDVHVKNVNCMNDPEFGPMGLRCQKCSRSFLSVERLEYHLHRANCTSRNSSIPRFPKKKKRVRGQCDRCGQLLTHLKSHTAYVNCINDPKLNDVLEKKKKKERQMCERCGVSFDANSIALHLALVNCTKDPDFVVDKSCKDTFRKHVCSKCNVRFAKRSSLTNHLAKVNCTNDPNFVVDYSKVIKRYPCKYVNCPRCGKDIVQEGLKYHLKHVNCNNDPDFIHPEKTVICEKCGKQFVNERNRKAHLATFHDVRDPNPISKPNRRYPRPSTKSSALRIKKIVSNQDENSVAQKAIDESEEAARCIMEKDSVPASSLTVSQHPVNDPGFIPKRGRRRRIKKDRPDFKIMIVSKQNENSVAQKAIEEKEEAAQDIVQTEFVPQNSLTVSPQDGYVFPETDQIAVVQEATPIQYFNQDVNSVLLGQGEEEIVVYCGDIPIQQDSQIFYTINQDS